MNFRRALFPGFIIFVLLGGLWIGYGRNQAVVLAEGGTIIGTGTAASCQSTAAVNALSAAVAAGGTIDFDCGLEQVIINVNTNITNQNVTINGKDLVYLSGEQLRQIFYVQDGGSLTLNRIAVHQGSAAQGGGIYIEPSASVEMNGGLLINSTSASAGGGVYNRGSLTLNKVRMYNNTALANGGGIFNSAGIVTINDSWVHYNNAQNGGGIYSVNGQLTLNSSTLFGNEVSNQGGGFYVSGPTQLTNSTISANKALRGGGLFLKGDASLLNVTIYRNWADEGGGIWKEASSNSTIKNSIVAFSFFISGGGSSLDCDGLPLTSLGRNIISDGTCLPNPGANGDLFDTPPKLANWDGSAAWGFVPNPDSPAVDYGLDCPAFDQRGFPRPLGAACDVGSMEFGGKILLPMVIR